MVFFLIIAKAEMGTYSQDGAIGSRLVIGEVDVENQGVIVAETWIGGEREKRVSDFIHNTAR